MPVIITGNNTPTAGGITYGDGTTYAVTAAGTSGRPVVSGGAGAPTFRPYTLPAADGSASQVLQTNGSGALSFATPSTGAMSLISTQSGSGSSAVTWSGLSGSTNYLLILSGLADTTANRDTRVRVGTGGTILTSNYKYSGIVYGSGGPAAYGGTSATGLFLTYLGTYFRYFYGFIYITQPPDYSAVNFNGATNDNTFDSLGNVITGAVPTSAIISDVQVYSTNNFNFGSAALYKMSV